MAPVRVMAQNAITHSGRFRMTMATRSPCVTPNSSRNRCASVQAIR